MSSAVTTPVKLGRLQKSDIRRQKARTIYNVYKFLKDISEQPEHFSTINVHFNSSPGNQVLASSRKANKRKHNGTDMNNFDRCAMSDIR
jgi:hypothetical protein